MKKQLYFIISSFLFSITIQPFYILFEIGDKNELKEIRRNDIYEKFYNLKNKYIYPMSSINNNLFKDKKLLKTLYDKKKSARDSEEIFLRKKVKKVIGQQFDVEYIPNIYFEFIYLTLLISDYNQIDGFSINKSILEINDYKNLNTNLYPSFFKYLFEKRGCNAKDIIDSYNLETNRIIPEDCLSDPSLLRCEMFYDKSSIFDVIDIDRNLNEAQMLNFKKLVLDDAIKKINKLKFVIFSENYINNVIVNLKNSNSINSKLINFNKLYNYFVSQLDIIFDKNPNFILGAIDPVATDSYENALFNLNSYENNLFNLKLSKQIYSFFKSNKKMFSKIYNSDMYFHKKNNRYLLYRTFIPNRGLKKSIIERTFYVTKKEITLNTVSYNNSIFGGFMSDPGACSLLILIDKINKKEEYNNICLFAFPIIKKHFNNKMAPFYVAPLSPFASIYSKGEFFHSRTKIPYKNLNYSYFKNKNINPYIDGIALPVTSESDDREQFFKDIKKDGNFLFINVDPFQMSAELVNFIIKNNIPLYDSNNILKNKSFIEKQQLFITEMRKYANIIKVKK